MENKIKQIHEHAICAFEQAKSQDVLDRLRIEYLGRKGKVAELFTQMGSVANEQKPVTFNQGREQEIKNWVYDLIKGEGEFVFVAEVPGPEDKIAVRLVDGMLYVRGTGGFSKEVYLTN